MTQTTLVLVGNAQGGTISVLRLGDNSLDPVATTAVGAGCATFAVDAARDLVHVATKEPEPGIVTWRLDRSTGELTEVSRRPLPDTLAYLHLTRDGGLLLGASYHGGWGAAWPVDDGAIGEETSRVEHANIHCAVSDAAGRFAYFVSLGDDLIAQCAVTDDGVLEPLDEPTVALPDGTGPRHLVLAANEQSAYLMTEFTGEAIRFERDAASGALAKAESVEAYDTTRGLSLSRFGADPKEEHLVWGADLHLAGFGAVLLATERTESTLAVVRMEPDGLLGGVVGLIDTEEQPRGFGVAPDDRHVVVVGERSGHASLYRLDDEATLDLLGRVPTGEGPNWVRFV